MQSAGWSGNQAAGNPLALVEETLVLRTSYWISQWEIVRNFNPILRLALLHDGWLGVRPGLSRVSSLWAAVNLGRRGPRT
jgi:hypothetical protein